MNIYKSETCLWKITSKDYPNRNFKTQAYDKLNNSVKTVYPQANRTHSLGGSFHKELKRVQE
jgi:hypothetical protein